MRRNALVGGLVESVDVVWRYRCSDRLSRSWTLMGAQPTTAWESACSALSGR
jgi:hypothetical protein